MTYEFTTVLWEYPGKSAWHFVTLPKEYAQEITYIAEESKRGFGSVRVTATIGSMTWQTSIFPDTSANSYLLPIKKAVRIKEKLTSGMNVTVKLAIGI